MSASDVALAQEAVPGIAPVLECLICMEATEFGPQGRLFRPCKCRGSRVHEGCLEKWRAISVSVHMQCPVCQYKYRLSRPTHAWLLTHPVVVTLVTFCFIAAAVIVLAYLIRFFGWLLFGVKLAKSAFTLTRQMIWFSVMTLGLTTLVLTFLLLDDGQPQLHFSRTYVFLDWIDPGLATAICNGSALMGFGVFMMAVWHAVRYYMDSLLQQVGHYVLEVEDD
jgi:hypothetical protein